MIKINYNSDLNQVSKEIFIKSFDNFNDNDLLKEILYVQQLNYLKLELIRSNTSKLVWFLIVIPIIVFILYSFLTLGKI